ncbi:cob(I)yrinic acid a,c-diamide adenosyltransferase [Candidatus Woesearchaeota archaeon]|nr:cob(I)yrinic acid a,c-diamide adenosyltransferase [Candidatus Woesearchaeota archaeon]
MNKGLGLVHVYTGHGKGKTTASMGLAMRAIGQGFSVYIVQFLKGGSYTGEFISSNEYLPKVKFLQSGKGCVKAQKQLKLEGKGPSFITVRDEVSCGACRYCFIIDANEEQNTKKEFEHVVEMAKSGEVDLLILDEINCVIGLGIISVDEILDLMKNKAPETELVLTGRHAHPKIIEAADLVTEMKEVKHYYNQGVGARRGIEY